MLFGLEENRLPVGYPPGGLVSPFVVSRPAWLTGEAALHGGADPKPRPPSWEDRPLIFFAGHVPKLSISTTRYRLWERLRREPNVTTLSTTINCTIG
eukprot:6741994-Prymnesium_polylepis.1